MLLIVSRSNNTASPPVVVALPAGLAGAFRILLLSSLLSLLEVSFSITYLFQCIIIITIIIIIIIICLVILDVVLQAPSGGALRGD